MVHIHSRRADYSNSFTNMSASLLDGELITVSLPAGELALLFSFWSSSMAKSETRLLLQREPETKGCNVFSTLLHDHIQSLVLQVQLGVLLH